MIAHANGDDVVIVTDAATARDLANAWEFAHSSGFLNDQVRPAYFLDVAELRRAAAYTARSLEQHAAATVPVPFRLVTGGQS